MNRRAVLAGAGALVAAGCRSTPRTVELRHYTAEELLTRVRDNGARGKVTALHFWATWCGPCIEEFPLLEDEWRGWMRHDDTLDFLAVSVDEPKLETVKTSGLEAAAKERDAAVLAFAAEHRATFPLAIAKADDPEEFANAIDEGWPSVLPSTLLFGLDGTVKHRNIGELRVSRFREKVRQLSKR